MRLHIIMLIVLATAVPALSQATSAPASTQPSAKSQAASAPAKGVLRMSYTGGWGAGSQAEFELLADGTFTYSRTGDPPHVGKLPQSEITALVEKLSEAGKGPGAEDAGYVTFEFVNAKGELERKEYSMPRAAPAKAIIDSIQSLAAKYDKGLKVAQTRPSSTPAHK